MNRTALVHDYLNQRGGAERVFARIAQAYPGAPVFTSLYDAKLAADLVAGHDVHASWLAKIPGANAYFRALAPLYPKAFESFDFSGYETIVSSTTSWAKGIIVPPGAVHVCYINTVSRFLFAYDEYVGGFGMRGLARPLIDRLVQWDLRAAKRPTAFIANSENVARRVKQFYGRDAYVLHCPVDVNRFSVGAGGGKYFLVASRLLPYKRVDLAIKAASLAGVKLLVAGVGPAQEELRALAAGTTTTMLGYVDDAELNRLLGAATAAVLPGSEDFGLVPLEAAAAGRPTIAFNGGGARETIVAGRTGEFFDDPEPRSLAAAMQSFQPERYDSQGLRAHAERFSPEQFIARLHEIVDEVRAAQACTP
ncbi:MAG: glycosyltransferase [Candidatus Eremiobacteraeota bacterium]|nr:glycosyltransferase [Candidatus Eremiobacteraeota bacterium]